jgi:GMP synthase (glutamine-hydrolysing)
MERGHGAIRFLLLQIRNPDDPMAGHEIDCFARSFGCDRESITVLDLLRGAPAARDIDNADVVLLGGSGDHSVVRGGEWLPAALESMRELYRISKPTFASCWGFQAMARALGGQVVTDHSRTEVGTVWLRTTEAGKADPVFAPLGDRFQVQIGHEDIVTELPPDAILLASSDRVENQAFRFEGKPIYCTQFHPELDRAGLLHRLVAYPEYLPFTGFETVEELGAGTPETHEVEAILPRFIEHAVRTP